MRKRLLTAALERILYGRVSPMRRAIWVSPKTKGRNS